MRGLSRARFWLLLLIPIAAIFGPVLLTRRTFGLRDVAHYYGPLWRYVNEQWREGVPLWNDLEENGRPLAADVTASVFYPAKSLFLLPLSFDTAMELYIMLHLVLAMAGAYYAARRFRSSREGASLAAMSYALSGTVVFLHCNPVFLVGAAWLPIGLGLMQHVFAASPSGSGWVRNDSNAAWRAALLLGAVLAMMVLGGDPQAAYLLMLTGGIRVLVRPTAGAASRGSQLAGLAGAALVALLLAAVQVLPTYVWSRESDRATYDAPRSLTELAGEIAQGEPLDMSGFYGMPRPGSHRAAVYQFSVGPWRWAELLWPNFGGRPFPENQRWMAAIPAEGRYWTPTLYMGLLPVLLGLTAIRRASWTHPIRRWLIVCVIFFALASLGQYGLVWLIGEIQAALGIYPPERWGAIGGLYWLMTIVLPGFVMFRYPSKLWLVVTLSLSLLAAMQADHLARRDTVRLRRILTGYLLLCLIPFIGAMSTMFRPDGLAAPVDIIYGPFDVDGAVVGVLVTTLHAVIVAAASWWVMGPKQSVGRGLMRWMVLITALDLSVAHYWLVPTVANVPTASSLLSSLDAGPPGRYLRWTIGGWYPQQWSIESDRDRLAQLVDWDRRTLRPKYNLDASMNALQSYASFSSANHRALVEVLYERSEDRSHSFYRLLDVVGTQYLIAPADQIHVRHLTFQSAIERSVLGEPSANVWRNDNAFPAAWVVHESRHLPPSRSKRRRERRQYIRSALLEPAEVLRQTVVLDEGVGPPARSSTPVDQEPASEEAVETCQVLSQRSGEIVLAASLDRAGYLVVSESYDPGWRCVVRTESGRQAATPVLRANGVMCAVALPRGQHRLTMRYRPTSFFVGATMSVLGGLGWFAMIWRVSRGPP